MIVFIVLFYFSGLFLTKLQLSEKMRFSQQFTRDTMQTCESIMVVIWISLIHLA